jgi:uncharacterized membrane protein YbhN (UPF0104 family)
VVRLNNAGVQAMSGILGVWLRRWGPRAVALTVAGAGLYVVMPGLLTLFGSWPRLADVDPLWFVLLVLLELGSFAALWWLTRLALSPDPALAELPAEPPPSPRWSSVATAQLAGNAASKVVPGGPAVGGMVQGSLLVRDGQPGVVVASALAGVGLLTTAVLLLLPVLTVPALLIGPPPDEQLQSGLLVSLILAVVLVALGVAALTWPRSVALAGRLVGRLVHLAKRSVTPDQVADLLLAQRARVRAVFSGHWMRAVLAAAANRMLDYAALVAALAAFDAHARPAEVLLAYVVAQALAMVPITPGGLGFVESGLTALLVVSGVAANTAVVGTLLYRLASFWLPIPVGALAWAGWRLRTNFA